jgi:hypothetical protein
MAEFARRSSDAWTTMSPSVFTFEGPISPSQQQRPCRPCSAAIRQDAVSATAARKARLTGNRVGNSPIGPTSIPTPQSATWHAVSAVPNSYTASSGTRVSTSDTAREFGLPATTHIGVVSSTTTADSKIKKVRPVSSNAVYGMLPRRRATIESISDANKAFPGAIIDGKLRNTAARKHSRNNTAPMLPNMATTTSNSRQVALLLPRPPVTTASSDGRLTMCPGHLLLPSYAQPVASRRQTNLISSVSVAHLTQNAAHLRDGLVSVGSYFEGDCDDVVWEEEPVTFGDPSRHVIPRVGFAQMPTNSPRKASMSPRGAVWR